MQISNHTAKLVRYSLLAAIGTIVFGLSIGVISRDNILGANIYATYAAFLLLGGGALALTLPWWNALDDLQKRGQMTSWYWGSMAGGLAFLLWLIAANDHHTPFSKGAFYMFLAQTAAAGICFAIWKIRGRGLAE